MPRKPSNGWTLYALVVGFVGGVALFLPEPHALAQAPDATPTPDPFTMIVHLAQTIFDAVTRKDWGVAAGAALVLAVAGFRWLVKVPVDEDGDYTIQEKIRLFLTHTDLGGVLSTVFIGFGGAIGTALLAKQPITPALLWTALSIVAGTSGVFVWGKKVRDAWRKFRAGEPYLPRAQKAGGAS